jgi:RHS repeat-associated protein
MVLTIETAINRSTTLAHHRSAQPQCPPTCHDQPSCCSLLGNTWYYDGIIVDGYEYRKQSPSAVNWFWTPLRMPGQYYDAETDLHENWHRYYDPLIGRYLEPDPVAEYPGFEVAIAGQGFADALNPYSYAQGNSVSFVDAQGKCPICLVALAALIVLGPVAHDSVDPVTHESGSPGVVTRALSYTAVGGAATLLDITRPAPCKPKLAPDALVCRGGTCSAERFAGGSGVSIDGNGNLQGVSVQSANGASVEQLTVKIQNNQVGVTTVREVEAAGGVVEPTPRPDNPLHATMGGITPTQAEELFTPTIRNPSVR